MSIRSAPSTTTARTAAARTLLAAQWAGVLADSVLLLLTLRLQRQRTQHDDVFAFLQAAQHFGIIEIALSELHDARMEIRLRAVADEYETRALPCWPCAHFRRRSERARATALSATLTGCAAG
jgi:hypothetical protein